MDRPNRSRTPPAFSSRDAELYHLLSEAVDLPAEQWRSFLEGAARDLETAREAEALLQGEAELGDFLAKPVVTPPGRAPHARSVEKGGLSFVDLVAVALDVDPQERRRALAERSNDDLLVRQVLDLLEAANGAADGGHSPNAAVAGSETSATAVEISRPGRRRDALPLRWGRFEVRRFLGAGGMGLVLEAFDSELERRVALKLIKAPTPELMARFQREARAQARVDHDNVCRVYEVGDLDGRPYIAMQYVEGHTLDEGASNLTLEQRVRVVAAASDGLHAAHREGLIHRDVKPSNVMFGDPAGGGLTVHVMDFGIAREVAGPGLTQTGATLGTPNYMAPEQVTSGLGNLDRRTDVYGLGATLHKVLTGRPPYGGRSSVEVMNRVLHEELPSPRRLVPSLPRDLETIVLKCLEKEPRRRYASARALADDLRRYLDGEPIEARRASRMYRLRRRARKHRAPLAVGAVAVVLLAAALVSAIAERVRTGAIAEASERFGREVESLTWIQRAAHQLPLHDVRAERELLRARMVGIETRMAGLGSAGRGPGLYALGRGHLALGEVERAESLLTTAWEGGYREPTVAEALGQALAARYESELPVVRRISDPAVREARRMQLEERFSRPALGFLRRGRDADLEAPELTEARIALLEGRWVEAETLARRTLARLPWRYGGHLIVGHAISERGREAEARGAYDEAEARYLEAEAAYVRATRVGASDPATWLALCRLGQDRALLTSNRKGLDARPLWQRALDACENSLIAEPDQPDALSELAMVYGYRAEALLKNGDDPQADLERAVAASRRAITIAPQSIGGWRALGLVMSSEGERLVERGEDAAQAFDESIASLERVVELDAEFAHTHHLLSLALFDRAREAERQKEDPEPWLDRASAEAERTIALAPRFVNAYLGASVIFWQRAGLAQSRGGDPLPLQMRGIEILRAVLEVDPGLGFAYVNLAAFLTEAAEATVRQRGGDPLPLLEESIASSLAALERVPEDAFAHLNLGHALVTRALWAAGLGEDPRAWLQQARDAFDQGIQRAPGLSGPPATVGTTWFYEALWVASRGGDPGDALDRAARWGRASRQRSASEPEQRILAARIAAMQCRRGVGAGGTRRAALARSRADLESARVTTKEAVEIHLALAWLELEQAWAALAAGGTDPAATRAGREVVDALLATDPELGQALGLRAGFLLLDAAQADSESAGQALRRQARDLLDRALAIDPMARLELGPILRRAGDSAAG